MLLDGNAEAEAKFFSVGGAAHSPDHRLFATAVDRNGAEYCKIGIRNLETGVMLVDEMTDAQGDMVWSADGRVLFYCAR